MKYHTIQEGHTKKFLTIGNDNTIQHTFLSDEKEKISKIKSKIDTHSSKLWDNSKKHNNEYEYIYTSSKIEKNISSIIPVSRSYFKLYEIIHDFKLLETDYNITNCCCIAEGPGGFIHCLNDYSEKNNKNIQTYGITLISKSKKVPYWNQSIIKDKNNHLCFGEDGTGDIYKLKNIEYFLRSIPHKCHLITADGGFDYSTNYNQQEEDSYKLLFCEVFIALQKQSYNGHFIIKVFDIFHRVTIQLLYFLYLSYEKIIIYKPSTSRMSNSEKYIVCMGYKSDSIEIIKTMKNYFTNCNELLIKIPALFLKELSIYNKLFLINQIDNIEKVLSLPKEIHSPTSNQLTKAIEWCDKYLIEINDKCIYHLSFN